MSTFTEKKNQARENIMEAFWKLFAQKPLNKISVSEIIKIAGYNRCTFYRNFEDIYDLVNQAEDTLILELKKNLTENYMNQLQIKKIAEFYDSHGNYFLSLLTKDRAFEFQQKVKKEITPYIGSLYESKRDEPYYSYMNEFFISAILSVITSWYKNGKDISSDEIVGFITTLIEEGIFYSK